MTNEQLYLAIGIPLAVNIGLVSLLYLVLSEKINGMREVMEARFAAMDSRFEAAHQALLRVEGVLDARLKHIEEAR